MTSDQTKILALVDTGAEVNIIGKGLRPHPVEGKPLRLTFADGNHEECMKWGEVEVKLEGAQKQDVTGVVLRDTGRLILGMPYLEEHKSVVDIVSNKIKVDGKWHELVRAQGAVNTIQAETDPDPVLTKAVEGSATDGVGREKLKQILWTFRELWLGDELGRTTIVEHGIEVTDPKPIACRGRRYNDQQKAVIQQEVADMLSKGESS
ncbi:hypothetical protein GNI_203320 [Gregarina niphandrodes]|uniref:Peptidase A2 domain-containing protein n=1 Tax=Gregarina niphandrodes TaxID=110365 RepID=A0A023AW72_GRENI|nr:hypothetical protein GNI_203320 [Gregarina niphandrodes]EZG42959.1 hypothetical protein GNI_203320 [Gregarina niphandrodes]|eukprot:XP_011133767.1 hypothetical protein GNI_203320 [Gregarina niphandrodes]